MSEDGNHCIHCGSCHYVSVGLNKEMSDVRYNDSLIYWLVTSGVIFPCRLISRVGKVVLLTVVVAGKYLHA